MIHFIGNNCINTMCILALLSDFQTKAQKAATQIEFGESQISRLTNRNEMIETLIIDCDATEDIVGSYYTHMKGDENASELANCWKTNGECMTFASHHPENSSVSTQYDLSMKRLMSKRSNF